MLSVNESTVKRWIDRGLLNAVRTPGGHRRVRKEDVQAFLRNQDTAREHSYILSRLMHDSMAEGWRKYFDLHRAFKHLEARTYVTGAMLACGSARCTLEDTVIPTLVKIGDAWQHGELDIADEHRMTFMIRNDLLSLDQLLPEPSPGAPRVLLACVPEENHEIVLQVLALAAREVGWHPIVLGINVPAREIIRVAEHEPIDMIALSKTYPQRDYTGYVREIRTALGVETPIIVGGAGWSKKERTSLTRLPATAYAPTLRDMLQRLQRCTAERSPTCIT